MISVLGACPTSALVRLLQQSLRKIDANTDTGPWRTARLARASLGDEQVCGGLRPARAWRHSTRTRPWPRFYSKSRWAERVEPSTVNSDASRAQVWTKRHAGALADCLMHSRCQGECANVAPPANMLRASCRPTAGAVSRLMFIGLPTSALRLGTGYPESSRALRVCSPVVPAKLATVAKHYAT